MRSKIGINVPYEKIIANCPPARKKKQKNGHHVTSSTNQKKGQKTNSGRHTNKKTERIVKKRITCQKYFF